MSYNKNTSNCTIYNFNSTINKLSISFRELENVHFVQNHSNFTIIPSYKKKGIFMKKKNNIIIKHFTNCIVIKRLKKKCTYNKK